MSIYTATTPCCRKVVAAFVADDPKCKDEDAKALARWVKAGYEINRVDTVVVMGRCTCREGLTLNYVELDGVAWRSSAPHPKETDAQR